ncbi:MAG: type II toxin-antitoxin system HicA family toxin [Lachnospiraceae bacterium]|nr:type II toxin-antitoxin system HicA family toxin [Lachnospiraceae bacterium]
MGQKEKLIKKLKSRPKDFTFDEAETLLGYYGYQRINKGKTSGSRVMFSNTDNGGKIILHKPHSRKELLEYEIKLIISYLEQEGLL